MDIICFRPQKKANLNDTFIEWGLKVLLTEVLDGPVRFHNVFFEPLDSMELPEHNLLVLCGTPWIWDQCTKSAKYGDLVKVLSLSDAPKIAAGIGTCFPLGFDCNTIEQAHTFMPGLENIFSAFSSITVRDKFAQKICELVKLRSNLLCCPAVFANEYLHPLTHKPDKDILFFYAPQFGLSRSILSEDFTRHYIDLQVDYATSNSAEVLCINPHEAQAVEKMGLKPDLLTSPEQVGERLLAARTLLSGRVHGCMFTAGLDISAALLPVDTRYMTYRYCGGKIIMSDQVSKVGSDDLKRRCFNYRRAKKNWKKFLKSSLKKIGLC